jgi:Rha family phage regulatory protein
MEPQVSINAERQPVVAIKDGGVFADSRDVAAFFARRHTEVLRAIRELIAKEPELGRRNFASFKINDLTGESTSHFEMDRDGFTLLAMGFTGEKALKWKLRYIEAFNTMEAELRARPVVDPIQALNDPSTMRGLLLTYSEKVLALEERNKELLGDSEALDRIAKADGSLCMMDAAKALQQRPKDLISYLQSHHWIYRRAGADHWVGYQQRLQNGDLEHKVTTVLRGDGSEKITEQVRVTPQGLAKLAKLFRPVVMSAG